MNIKEPTIEEILAIIPADDLAHLKRRFDQADDREAKEAVLGEIRVRYREFVARKIMVEPAVASLMKMMPGGVRQVGFKSH